MRYFCSLQLTLHRAGCLLVAEPGHKKEKRLPCFILSSTYVREPANRVNVKSSAADKRDASCRVCSVECVKTSSPSFLFARQSSYELTVSSRATTGALPQNPFGLYSVGTNPVRALSIRTPFLYSRPTKFSRFSTTVDGWKERCHPAQERALLFCSFAKSGFQVNWRSKT